MAAAMAAASSASAAANRCALVILTGRARSRAGSAGPARGRRVRGGGFGWGWGTAEGSRAVSEGSARAPPPKKEAMPGPVATLDLRALADLVFPAATGATGVARLPRTSARDFGLGSFDAVGGGTGGVAARRASSSSADATSAPPARSPSSTGWDLASGRGRSGVPASSSSTVPTSWSPAAAGPRSESIPSAPDFTFTATGVGATVSSIARRLSPHGAINPRHRDLVPSRVAAVVRRSYARSWLA